MFAVDKLVVATLGIPNNCFGLPEAIPIIIFDVLQIDLPIRAARDPVSLYDASLYERHVGIQICFAAIL